MEIIRDSTAAAIPVGTGRFTGQVWRTDVLRPATPAGLSGLRFFYAPGARSYWHVHECEQAIIAVFGCGVVAWEGLSQPVRLLPGDWWHVRPGVPHWHGATPDAPFAHLAVTAGGSTTWLHQVSEDDYRTPPAA